jgi:hypothetical protein
MNSYCFVLLLAAQANLLLASGSLSNMTSLPNCCVKLQVQQVICLQALV